MSLTKLLDFTVQNLTASGDSVFFTPTGTGSLNQLWTSNGTKANTTLVKNLASGGGPDASPSYLTVVNGKLLFAADTGSIGRELWSSDGSNQGTVLVKEVYAGPDPGLPNTYIPAYHYMTAVGGILFFCGQTAANGWELWKSDGSDAGTVLVKDINPGSAGGIANSSNPSELTAYGRTLLFVADDGSKGYELWRSDGTEAGTTLVKDISSNSYYESYPSQLTVVANQVFFTATDSKNGCELWKTDGTNKGTVLVANINPTSYGGYGYGSYAEELTAVGSSLFFLADSGSGPGELWISDGTSSGTIKVAGAFSNAADLTAVGTVLFFAANDANGDRELWKAEGASAQRVANINTSGSSTPSQLTAVNGVLYFSATTPDYGRELWLSDGSTAGTKLAQNIYSNAPSSNPESLTVAGGHLFFNATDAAGPGLWSLDLDPYDPPRFLKAVVSGSSAILTCNQAVSSSGSGLNAAYFRVLVGGVLVKATAATISGAEITLTLASSPSAALITDIFYCPPAGASTGMLIALDDGTRMPPQTINDQTTADSFRSSSSVSALALTYTTLQLLGTSAINGSGNANANTIRGNSAVNVINGLGGADNLDAGESGDIYLISSLSDYAPGEIIADSGSSGTDEIRFAATTANQTLVLQAAVSGIERIVIGTGTNAAATTSGTTALSLDASALSKGITLVGNDGLNTLIGTAYADTIISNKGNDSCSGGAGADSFVFNQTPGSTNRDTLTDFVSGSDKLVFSKAIYKTLGSGSSISADQLLIYSGTPILTASTRFLYNTSTRLLAYDSDGSGTKAAALDVATLTGVATLLTSDFTLIA